MKLKLLSLAFAATALITTNSQAVTLALSGITNTTLGLITVDPDGAGATPRATATGRAIFVSVTNTLTGVAASMNSLLASATSTSGDFDTALSGLITAGNTIDAGTNPGIVRSATFTNGLLNSTGSVQLGNSGNKTYLFLVAESGGFITGIGAYTGANVPTSGSVTFNPGFAGDGLLVGTSVFAAAVVGPPAQPVSGFQLAPAVAPVPEPSAALLGALGALGLLRRRRN